MPQSFSAPTRALPAKPSLIQLRKQAKDLFKAFQSGDAAVVAEVERFEKSPDRARFALADAQRVLARAYGFASWTRLKEHVDGLNVEALCAAVEAGDVATVRKLAKARPELVNAERGGGFGESIALHFAVLQRNADMTRALMRLNADARIGIWPYRDATTAHTIARERGYDEIVAIIEEEETRRRREASPESATIGAKTDEVLKAIVEGRCDEAIRVLAEDLSLAGACNLRGAAPLHVAAWAQEPQMIQWLLDRQAPVDAKDAVGKTPLDYAAIAAGWSAHGRHFCFVDNSGKAPEIFDATVRVLRSHGAELTPRAAVAIGDREAVLRMHRDGQLKNDIHSLRGGLLSIAVRVNRIDMVVLLLDLGLDPDETVNGDDGDRESWGMPLWFTAMCGRHEIAELLLARGADVNAIVSACGDAWCTADRTGDDAMKALLRRHGARLTVEHVLDRETGQAILNGKILAQSLNVEEPTFIDIVEQMLLAAVSKDPEIVRMCLKHITRQRDDPWWNYVLLRATSLDCFKLILDHGIDPDVGGEGGTTMLHHVATDYLDDQARLERAKMLLDAGASLGRRDPLLKSTPLGWACRWGRLGLVDLYLDRGADALEPESEPWATPLAWARKGDHRTILERLRQWRQVS